MTSANLTRPNPTPGAQAEYVLTSANLTRLAHAGALPWDAPDARAPLAAIGVGLAEFGHWVALVRRGAAPGCGPACILSLGVYQEVALAGCGPGSRVCGAGLRQAAALHARFILGCTWGLSWAAAALGCAGAATGRRHGGQACSSARLHIASLLRPWPIPLV